jgi:hypothetical protein
MTHREHLSITPSNLVVAQYLIEAGADVNAHDEEKIGETPLGEIVPTCSLAAAQLLIDAGADPTILGWMKITALDRVRRRTDAEAAAVQHLLESVAKSPD